MMRTLLPQFKLPRHIQLIPPTFPNKTIQIKKNPHNLALYIKTLFAQERRIHFPIGNDPGYTFGQTNVKSQYIVQLNQKINTNPDSFSIIYLNTDL